MRELQKKKRKLSRSKAQRGRLVITGGHLTPALALINEIKKDDPGWQIYYFGRKYALEGSKEKSFEFKTISQLEGVKFVPLVAGKLQRRWTRYAIVHLLKIPIGFLMALIWLLKIRPKLIISFGGYLSVPVVISGRLLGIPSITHEQTAAMGLANRINSLFVKKIAVSFPSLLKELDSKRAVWTGNPLRPEIFKKKPSKSSQLWSKIDPKKPLLYITGGKTGSVTINRVVKKIIPQLVKKFFVLHQIGLDQSIQPGRKKDYLAVRFVDNGDIGWVLNRAALVVSRAGANTVLELAALAKPVILIPIPWSAGNEQMKNAQFLKELGLAEIIEQDQLDEKTLLATIAKMTKNSGQYRLKSVNQDHQLAAKRLWQLAKSVL